MYRILATANEVRERRNQLHHPNYAKPELLATRPNQVWSRDITKLKGPVKWTYFYLYVMLDIFSRYVVGWMVAQRESAELAKRLIRDSCEKEGIGEGQLTIHSDRGSPMKAKNTGQLLADLGITKSHSRPYTSDDNPFSEGLFKTLKYRPGFPDRFGSKQHTLSWGRMFFPWYNQEHRHSGIAMLTPAMVHRGEAAVVLRQRSEVTLAAYQDVAYQFGIGRTRHTLQPSLQATHADAQAAQHEGWPKQMHQAASGQVDRRKVLFVGPPTRTFSPFEPAFVSMGRPKVQHF
jgi:putative transposase